MKRFLILSMVLGLSAVSVTTAEAEERLEPTERTLEVSYYGAQSLEDLSSCGVRISVGAGCVTVQALEHEWSLTASVTDAHGRPVHVYVVNSSDGKFYGRFCGYTTESIWFTAGAELEFWLGGEWWPTWWIFPELPECTPGVATTGTINLKFSGMLMSEESVSPSSVESPAPHPSPSGEPEIIERSVDLELRRHLRGVGSVDAADPSCHSDVPVAIQRKTSDAWLDIASTRTDPDGGFSVRLSDRPGRYRAIASQLGTAETTCLAARSTTVRHQH